MKFYPISKQQYKAILRLAKQPVVDEDSIAESHRSLADWSSTLQNSWNNVLNATKNMILPTTAAPNTIKNYPMCVIQTPESYSRQKRGASAYNYNQNYAGVAPNVIYSGSYPYPYPDNTPDYEDNENNEDYVDENIDTNPDGDIDADAPIINCVVVVRRKKPSRPEYPPETENPDEDKPSRPHYPHYPYPAPPHGYPPYGPYPEYPHHPPQYPHHPPIYPYPHPHPHPHPYPHGPARAEVSARSNGAALYQQMLNEYYKHLHALYRADAGSGTARGYFPKQYETNTYDDEKEDDKQNDDYDSDKSNES